MSALSRVAPEQRFPCRLTEPLSRGSDEGIADMYRQTSRLLIDEYPLMVLPKLAELIGLNEAIVLQQIHYWTDHFAAANDQRHFHDSYWWVWNSAKGWQSNFPFWSEHTIRRTLKSLRNPVVEKSGAVSRPLLVIVGNYNRMAYDKTLWYRVDYDALGELALPDTTEPIV